MFHNWTSLRQRPVQLFYIQLFFEDGEKIGGREKDRVLLSLPNKCIQLNKCAASWNHSS